MILALILLLVFNYWLFKIDNLYNSMGLFIFLSTLIYMAYGLLVYKVFKAKRVNYLPITLTAGVTFLLLLSLTPSSSNDVYRYFWDGLLTRNGINPYLVTPQDPSLAIFQNSELYKAVNWKGNFTPYPPIAQILFVVASGLFTTFGMIGGKVLFLLPVIIGAVFIYKYLDKKLYAVFILNPLLTLESAQAAHIDSYVVLCLFLSIYLYFKDRFKTSSFFLAIATLIKIYPGFFFPFLFVNLIRRKKIKEAVVFTLIPLTLAIIFYLPFIKESLFPITRYVFLANEQEFNASFYRYFYQILGSFVTNPKEVALSLCTTLFLATSLFLLRKRLSINLLIGEGIVYLIFSTIVFPWYTLFFIPLVILEVKRSGNLRLLIYLIVMQFIITCTYFEPKIKIQREWMLNVEYLILTLILIINKVRLQVKPVNTQPTVETK